MKRNIVFVISLLLICALAEAQERKLEMTAVFIPVSVTSIIELGPGTTTVTREAKLLTAWIDMALKVGDEVCVASTLDNYAVVSLNKNINNTVRLEAGSCLKITASGEVQVDGVDLNSGVAWFDIGALEEGSTFEVETPTAVVGVQGTFFRVEVDSLVPISYVQVFELSAGHTMYCSGKEISIDVNTDGDIGDFLPDKGDLAINASEEASIEENDYPQIVPCPECSDPDIHPYYWGIKRQQMGEIATEAKSRKVSRPFDEEKAVGEDEECVEESITCPETNWWGQPRPETWTLDVCCPDGYLECECHRRAWYDPGITCEPKVVCPEH